MWGGHYTVRYPACSARSVARHAPRGPGSRGSRGGPMGQRRGTVFRRGSPRVRDWPFWSLTGPSRLFIFLVICGYLAWIGALSAAFRLNAADLGLFASLLLC